jgi:hypothetical protein
MAKCFMKLASVVNRVFSHWVLLCWVLLCILSWGCVVMLCIHILCFSILNIILIVITLTVIVLSVLLLVTSWHRDRSIHKEIVLVWSIDFYAKYCCRFSLHLSLCNRVFQWADTLKSSSILIYSKLWTYLYTILGQQEAVLIKNGN